ncbi:DUF1707 domain-containing protein [Streptomyces sp. SCA3-4]|uniref:DUF1707 SHOCT-like domain-containing protein n=1 Tax=Streptomyces sichuanensis TaxID=2871810 RepID=UPI001CE389FC|nr:DUF1707 domain-containing protein [Streptomyces sichuanensis]MCA6095815.1 DUF1707 domain-containing protein [Streptomyces sichuanensis]
MTSELPEMRASDAERERVAEALREAVAEGRLDMEEFEERLEAAYKARTHAELEPLVRDLPVPSGAAASAPAAAGDEWAARIGGRPTSKGAVGIMGGFQRRGGWTVPRVFTAFVFWGGGEIDLREARFEDREVVVRCIAVMGGMQVIVPPELDVQVGGVGIMGGFDDKATGPGTPGSPTVHVTGFAFWGGVGVDRKVTRAERKRLREERREQRRLDREERRGDRGDRGDGGNGSGGGGGKELR